jgi:arginyl-tRNA synthetase
VFSASDILPRLLLPYIHDRGVAYGYDDSLGLVDRSSGAPTGERKKVIVEFSSPNMAMEFQTSHLRSTLIGASIANLYERQGWKVVRMNYLGDWGKHIGLLACGYQRFGSEDAFEKDPMHHLADVYRQIGELFKPEQEASKAAKNDNKDAAEVESQGIYAERDAFFKKMEDGDADAMALWQRFRDATVNYYQHAYARLGIKFDEYSGESQVSQESVSAVETALRDKGVCEESEGSWIINFAKHDAKGLGVAMMRYRNGTTSYLLRDVAAVLDRDAAFSFDKMIYVVAMEQDNHFGRVIKTLQLMGNEELALK